MPTVARANWSVTYLGSSEGSLRLANCDFAGVRAIHSAAVPFVYVNYKGSTMMFTDTLTVADPGVVVREIMNGFDLKASYDFGEDYLYEHVWRFHDDGQFGSMIVIHGPGEEIQGRHTYHIPFRFDLDVSGSSNDSLQKRSSAGRWVEVAKEGQQRPVRVPDWDWRVVDETSGRNARVRARLGDNAELWALRYKRAESLSAAGGLTLQNPPGTPGSVPAIYDNGESIQDTYVVLWYIAHLSASERIAACGPWFKLGGYPDIATMPNA